MSRPSAARPLVLVGMMGSGKSSVGVRLAAMLDRPFVDLDTEISRTSGRAIDAIFDESGEAGFRQLESVALAEALHAGAAVIATGGGAVLDADNRRRLRGAATVVWLRAPAEVLVERVGGGAGRPLLGADPREAIERLLRERAGLYEEVADVTVDVDDLDVELAAERIIAMTGCGR